MSQPTTLRQRLPGVLWSAFLGALLAVGGLSVLLRIWGTLSPGILGPAAAALVGGLLCAAAARQTARPALAWGLRLGPWLALLLAGAGSLWQGLLLWLNSGIAWWNGLHQGGAALFPTMATTGSVMLVSLAAGAALGQLSYGLVTRHRTALCGVYCGVLALAALLTGTLSAVWGSLLFAAFLGVWVTHGAALPARQARCLWGTAAVTLLVCAVLTPSGELVRVTRLRQQAVQQLQTVRYGEDHLPQGALRQAASLNSDDAQALTVQTEQIKTLYLRGYVGAVYRDGVWKPLPASAYSGDYAGMLQWLARQGFDPLVQPAAYYSLCEADDRPENNHLTVSVTGASRRYLYLPTSLAAVKGANTADRKDQRLTLTDMFGARTYTADELSSSRPAELTVRAAWVGQPQTEAQRAYTQAEAVYREFISSIPRRMPGCSRCCSSCSGRMTLRRMTAFTAPSPACARCCGRRSLIRPACSRRRRMLIPSAIFLPAPGRATPCCMHPPPCRRCAAAAFPHAMSKGIIFLPTHWKTAAVKRQP